MKWAIEVQRTVLTRRNLADLLGGIGFTLIDGDQFPMFTSQEINQCETASQVMEIGKKVCGAFSGPAGIDVEFTLGAVIDFVAKPPKRHLFLKIEPLALDLQFGSMTLTARPPVDLTSEELRHWEKNHYQSKLAGQRARLEPAYVEPRAAKVFEYLSVEQPTGEILNKIYELVEGNPSRRQTFQQEFGIDKNEFNRFSDSVHNPVVSGDWARHAYDQTPRTINPMSRSEAERFVREIAERWLLSLRTSI